MSEYTSNIDALAAKIQEAIDSFGFRSAAPGGSGDLGEACAKAVAEDIHSSALDGQEEPDGTQFPDNEDRYAAMKAAKYGRTGRSFGFRTGQTLSVESLMGQVEASDDELTMRYGTGRIVSQSDGGSGYVADSDRQQTDIEKMYILTNLAAKRIDVYKVGPYAEKEIKILQAQALERHIKSRTGG